MYERAEEFAKYWVEQAIHFYKCVGRDVALAEFSHPNGMFVENEAYILILSLTGTVLAHGVNEKFVGLDFSKVRDTDGKLFIAEILENIKSKGSGWVEYKWYHPRKSRVLPKMSYCQLEEDMIFCSAVYGEGD